MLHLRETSAFENILGSPIIQFSSTSLHVHDGDFNSLEINLLIAFKNNNILFKCDRKVFFENEDSDVFYDYDIETKNIEPEYTRASISFSTSEIIQIEIYGREFNENDFITYPELYQKIKGIKKTDDLFIFNCKKGERIMIVFHPFLPSIEVYFKESRIKGFLNQFGEKYSKHYMLKNDTHDGSDYSAAMTYNGLGNIIQKSDAGKFAYGEGNAGSVQRSKKQKSTHVKRTALPTLQIVRHLAAFVFRLNKKRVFLKKKARGLIKLSVAEGA